MSVATRTAAQALRRLSFTFAADGSRAACLASAADGGWYVESWRLPLTGPAVPTALPLPDNRAESLHSQLVALPGGAVLICRHDGERHELALLSATGPEPAAGQSAAPLGPAGSPTGATPVRETAARETPAAVDAATAVRERRLATLRMPGLRLLPTPVAPGTHRPAGAPVAVALGSDTRPATTVWLVRTDGTEPHRVAEIPGLHGGGVWLDHTGALLALDRVDGGTVRTVVLDLRSGTVTPLLEIGERSNDRLVLFDPDTRFAMVRSDAPGTDRLGWGVLGSGDPLRFPDGLHLHGMFLRPIALQAASRTAEPGGGAGSGCPAGASAGGGSGGPGGGAGRGPIGPRVALQIDHGAGSTLALWRPGGGRPVPLAVPPGRLGAVGHWSAAGLRMPYSAPDHPAALATLDIDALLAHAPDRTGADPAPPLPLQLAPLPLQLAPLGGGLPGTARRDAALPRPVAPGAHTSRTAPPGWQLDGSTPPNEGGHWRSAHVLELAGPAGPLEAVVYGGDTWLSSPHLVLALHGGPADAWRLEFDPALQRMASDGLAVLAPNQRGSTGYGLEHALAIRGAWGGPDLDDILYLLDAIAGQRAALGLEPPSLFGVSYGAFLALLAAAHAPADHLARCAVVAPFLSGARLLAEASAPVRALCTRLGGADPVEDARGPRDVLQLAHRLTAPLLIVHGDRDEVVPVGQSRSLRHELLRIGRTEGADFRYVEAAGSGHEVLAEEGGAVLHELLAGFLRTGRPG
ncbi:alpha/beta hydrolase family protein [Kitasatospora sp. NPDC054939]